MTNSRYRNVLIAVGVAAALSTGAVGCSKSPESSAKQAGSSQAITDTATPTVAEAAKTTGEAVMATGDAAGQAMSDTWITTKIKSVLLADSAAKGLDVKVDTKDGVVTLKGVLATQSAVDHVKKLAGDVEGVKRVNAYSLTVARS
jgi:hyperosmotically inducible periplasmic protein